MFGISRRKALLSGLSWAASASSGDAAEDDPRAVVLPRPIPIPHFGEGHLNLPQPQRIYTHETSPSRFFCNDATVDEAFSQLRIVDHPRDMSVRDTLLKLSDALNFLNDNFGPPLRIPGLINISISDDRDHSTTELSSDGQRRIKYLSNSVVYSKQGVVAHELFHAFYQPDKWLIKGSDTSKEGWAFYVQTLYSAQYEPGGMSAVVKQYKQDLRRIPPDVKKRVLASPFRNLNATDQQLAYLIAAMPLLEKPLGEVRQLYQGLRASYSNACSHSSNLPSRRQVLALR